MENKNKHHLFTKYEVRKALIRIFGKPKTDEDHNKLHEEIKWAWVRLPKFKMDMERHRMIHLPYKYGLKPSKELIKLRKRNALK